VPLSRDVQVLADLFDRGDVKQLQAQLDEAQNLADVIRDFRMADPPWPERPRMAAVFALELGVAGLRSDNGFARDQGARLLAEYSTRIRRPQGADTFECVWLWAETAALGGLLRPSLASGFVSRAAARCPDEPRLQLAAAIVAEQEWLSFRQPDATSTAEVIQRYTAAMTFTETALEARVRAAFFLLRTGQPARALELLEDPSQSGADAYVAYLAWLVRGQVLAALGRPDESMAALRRALIVWPGGQAARVSLMTLLFVRGDREEAAALAEAIQTAGEEQSDPWWTYLFGDFRVYPAILTRLRNLAG
jgi:tetratricopeptide (TPR) repeat protein